MQQPELIDFFIRPLEDKHFEYMITGSVAAIFYGHPRLTHDIDIVLHLTPENLELLYKLFPPGDYYIPPKEVINCEMSRTFGAHFNIIHPFSGLKADCYLNTGNPLHIWAMTNRKRIAINETLNIWIAPPEYVIVRKLLYFQEGGSHKHLHDIRGMILCSSEQINRKVLKSFLKEHNLISHWNRPEFAGLPL